jgi:hypothetical protein
MTQRTCFRPSYLMSPQWLHEQLQGLLRIGTPVREPALRQWKRATTR